MTKKQEREKAFNNWKANSVHLNFPNGNRVSSIWGVGAYCENHYLGLSAGGSFLSRYNEFTPSNDVEVMVDCSEKLLKKLQKKFDADNPFGYLSITDWLYVVNAVAKDDAELETK